MTQAEVYGEITRDGLLSVLDTRAADELLTRRPYLAEDVAIAIGEARLRAGCTMTRLSMLALVELIEAGVAGAHSFDVPLSHYNLDAALQEIRDTARQVAHGSNL